MALSQKSVNIILISIAVMVLCMVCYNTLCPKTRENFSMSQSQPQPVTPTVQQQQQAVQQQAVQQQTAQQQTAQQQTAQQQTAQQQTAQQQAAQQQTAQQQAVQQQAAQQQTAQQQAAQQQAVQQQAVQQQAVQQQTAQQVPQIEQNTVEGVRHELKGAPILPEVDYNIQYPEKNTIKYRTLGKPLTDGGIGHSINGLESYHMNEQNKCAITRDVFHNLNENGFMTNDQVPQTWDSLYKSSCGDW